jgi:hypothetical protein
MWNKEDNGGYKEEFNRGKNCEKNLIKILEM